MGHGGSGRSGRDASLLRVGAVLGAVLLAAVTVFSLGVMVGGRVSENFPTATPPPAALPTEGIVPAAPPPMSAPSRPEAPAAAVPVPPEKMTFYDRLSGKTALGPIDIPDGEAPVPASTGEPRAATVPAATDSKSAKTATPARPAPAKSAAVSPSPQPASLPSGNSAVLRIRRLAGKGSYRVQVAASSERREAENIAAGFNNQGLEADTTIVVVKGKTWHRVRVGRFPDQPTAARAAEIFKSVLGVDGRVVRD